MRIDIVSDTICPWCYIGKRRFERALRQSGVEAEIAWRPFQLNPDMPKDGMERSAYLAEKFGGSGRADEIYAPIREAGDAEGIAFAFERIRRTPNTMLSHRLIHHAGTLGRQDAVVEGLFVAYFVEGRNVGAIEELAAIGEAAGLDRATTAAYLSGDTDLERVAAEDEMARRMGIHGVPCFIIERRLMVSGAQSPEIFERAFTMARETPRATA
ncbi:MAG: DsbA family oxidoreductase [Alphaproteobacteria bacterium]